MTEDKAHSFELGQAVRAVIILSEIHSEGPPVLLELVQSVADDVATCSKLDPFGRRRAGRAGR